MPGAGGAGLASDPGILDRSGGVSVFGDLAPEYGVPDLGGRQPPPSRSGANLA
jgi:hypothetical protein